MTVLLTYEGYALYEKALCAGDYSSLADWVRYIKTRFENKGKKTKKT